MMVNTNIELARAYVLYARALRQGGAEGYVVAHWLDHAAVIRRRQVVTWDMV